jgi:chain length determinant protein tyrosine kinase EpsG
MERLYQVRTPPGQHAPIEDRPIGQILVDMGKLRAKDVRKVFDLHRRKGLRFGEAARRLRLVDDADVQYALSIQFNYPYSRPGQGMLGAELIAAHDPFDPQSEALRALRTELVMRWAGEDTRVLAVASCSPRDGRTYLAANLAVVFAQLGEPTLLVDADLRAPRLHRIFALGTGLGLAQVLSGRAAGLAAAEAVPYFDSLTVLGAGTMPPNPLELLSRPQLGRLFDEARRAYSIVIVDTPAAARGADARVVSSRADGTLIVARQDRTRLMDLERLRAAVSASGTPVIGTVLNRL